MADIRLGPVHTEQVNAKMLEKVVYNLFIPESNMLAIFITPFSRKVNFRHHTQKMVIFENGSFDVWVCGFKIEICGYPINSFIITYPPYKYEIDRMKTHEIRAKYFISFFRALYGVDMMIYVRARTYARTHAHSFIWTR